MSEKRVPELRFKGFNDAWRKRLWVRLITIFQ